MFWREGERVQWNPIEIGSDADLIAKEPPIRGLRRSPTLDPAKRMFEGFKKGLEPHRERSPVGFEITDADYALYNAGDQLGRETRALFVLRDVGQSVSGFQYQRDVIAFRPTVFRNLSLLFWYPARGGGGFDISAELDGGKDERLSFRFDYAPSEAGAFRLMRALSAIGELLSLPVRFDEASDC